MSELHALRCEIRHLAGLPPPLAARATSATAATDRCNKLSRAVHKLT
jgi:hypothetical protein